MSKDTSKDTAAKDTAVSQSLHQYLIGLYQCQCQYSTFIHALPSACIRRLVRQRQHHHHQFIFCNQCWNKLHI